MNMICSQLHCVLYEPGKIENAIKNSRKIEEPQKISRVCWLRRRVKSEAITVSQRLILISFFPRLHAPPWMGRDIFLTPSTSAKFCSGSSRPALFSLRLCGSASLPLCLLASALRCISILTSSVVFCLLSLFKLSEIAAVFIPFSCSQLHALHALHRVRERRGCLKKEGGKRKNRDEKGE